VGLKFLVSLRQKSLQHLVYGVSDGRARWNEYPGAIRAAPTLDALYPNHCAGHK
jgi:hypothetical protein